MTVVPRLYDHEEVAVLNNADRKWLGEMRKRGAAQLDASERARLWVMRRYHGPKGEDALAVDVLLGLAQEEPPGGVRAKAAALIRDRHPDLGAAS